MDKIAEATWDESNVTSKTEVRHKAQTEGKTLNTCATDIEYCSCHQRLARAEFQTKQRLRHCELPVSLDSSVSAPSSNESDADDIGYGVLIDRVDLKQVHQQQHNHGRTHLGVIQDNHGKVIGHVVAGWTVTRFVGPIGIPHMAVAQIIQTDLFTGDRRTQMTHLMNIMVHTKLTQSNLSVSSAGVNACFPAEVNVLENLSLLWLAQSKSKFIAQD